MQIHCLLEYHTNEIDGEVVIDVLYNEKEVCRTMRDVLDEERLVSSRRVNSTTALLWTRYMTPKFSNSDSAAISKP